MEREHDYFNTDKMLSEDERVIVKVQVPLYNMKWMKQAGACEEQDTVAQQDDRSEDSEDEGNDLASGTFLSLPLWVAAPLLRGAHAQVSVPRFFDRQFLDKLMSHPFDVDLSRQATPYYYEFAHSVSDSLPRAEDSNILKKAAMDVFIARMSDVMRSSEVSGHDSEETKLKLPELEKHLFEATRKERHAKRKWSKTYHYNEKDGFNLPPYLR